MAKKRYCVTLDEELVDLHKIKVPIGLSTDVNNYLRESLLVSDELDQVNKEIERCERKLQLLRPKQTRLEQMKVNEINNRNNYALAYDTLCRMHEVNDCIGENQLKTLAVVRKLDYTGLIQYCKDEGFNVVKINNPQIKNGGS